MDTDLILVIGVVLAAFSVPAMLNAYSESRPLLIAASMVLAAASAVVFAISQSPGEFMVSEIPQAFVRVIGRFAH